MSIDVTCRKHKTFIQELDTDIKIRMALIPSGKFLMGTMSGGDSSFTLEGRQPYNVNIKKPFLIGHYPITKAQWLIVSKMPQINQALPDNPDDFRADDCSVQGVTWLAAQEFCARLSAHTKNHYRLPSESEWEYACRANDKTSNSPICRELWEWCEDDWYRGDEKAPNDGSAWIYSSGKDIHKVIRGGPWYNFPPCSRPKGVRALSIIDRFSCFAPMKEGIGFRIVNTSRII
jgi:formylglycine-generating enzyme required for sulfatase activity